MYNQLKTLVFLTLLSSLLMAVGYLMGGTQGIIIGFVFALLMNFVSYWFSDKIILKLHHAQEISSDDSMGLFEVVERISLRANIPTPKIYIIPDHIPNAFATGRDPYHSAVAVTQGLLSILNIQELEGVLAHEIAHIKNRDTLISCVAATLAAAILFAANMAKWSVLFGGTQRRSGDDHDSNFGSSLGLFVMVFLAPIAATLIQFAISRSREFIADESGARFSGNPEWLAMALRKIHNISAGNSLADATPATAHLYIVNPISGGAILNLFSTHPPVEERIQKLLEMRKYGYK